jgi:endo-1,4-beta-xylanase
MQKFISEYAGKYAGQIYSWDVVNEAFKDGGDWSGDWRNHLRKKEADPKHTSPWFLAFANGANEAEGECGSDYIYYAFRFARMYDSNAILYYNDYNEEIPTKREAIAQMVEDINKRWERDAMYDGRLLIEGIGMQSHYNQNTDIADVRVALQRYIETGARIAITELDITFGSEDKPASMPLTPEIAIKQASMYAELFQCYMQFSRHIERVTIWGKLDNQSWQSWGAPTLFDKNLYPKDAFWAVMDPYYYAAEMRTSLPLQTVPKARAVFATPILGQDLALWNQAPEILINTSPINQSKAANATGKLRLLWDKSHIYARVFVAGLNIDKSKSTIEIFISETLHRQSQYVEGDGQYSVSLEGKTSTGGLVASASKTNDGYIIEMRIPFKVITPTAGTKIGFDVQISDFAENDEKLLVTWSNLRANSHHTTENWGEVELT